MRIHSVHKLIEHRHSISTKAFNARGSKVVRCQYCQIAKIYCICPYQPDINSNVSALILMSKNEVLKPSNTGRLIADVIKDTYTFQWNRTEPEKELVALLRSTCYQPIIVFPEEYVLDSKRVLEHPDLVALTAKPDGKRLLLVFIDSSWRESRKIFRKSPYLDSLPVVSIKPEILSQYVMRKSDNENHLSTAEVANIVLEMVGEEKAAHNLRLWFELFRESYLLTKTRMGADLSRPALANYVALTNHNALTA